MIACTASSAQVASRLDELRTRIERAGGDPATVSIVAVTKGFDASAIHRAREAGLTEVGESYAPELVAKAGSAPPGTRWHFVGRLQRNKVRRVAPLVTLWQSVDRPELGAEIARHAPGASVLVQVNISGEAQKGGCPLEGATALVHDLTADGLDVQGVMGIAALGDPDEARRAFRRLRALADDLALPVRSMGMTADLAEAVAEGSTMVRVGTALFGPRVADPNRASN